MGCTLWRTWYQCSTKTSVRHCTLYVASAVCTHFVFQQIGTEDCILAVHGM